MGSIFNLSLAASIAEIVSAYPVSPPFRPGLCTEHVTLMVACSYSSTQLLTDSPSVWPDRRAEVCTLRRPGSRPSGTGPSPGGSSDGSTCSVRSQESPGESISPSRRGGTRAGIPGDGQTELVSPPSCTLRIQTD